MKMQGVRTITFVISTVLLLPGCGRIMDWGKRTLYQGEVLNADYAIPRSFMRSAHAYDQFATVARFDVLWLSPEVRTSYVDFNVRLGGRNPDQRALLLKKQQDEIVIILFSMYSRRKILLLVRSIHTGCSFCRLMMLHLMLLKLNR